MYALQGKVAVVTGAGSGIGRATAKLLAAKGCKLAIADVNEATLRETAAMLPPETLASRLDVSDRGAVYAFADAVKQRFGTAHVVVNNAGVNVSQYVADLGWDDFEWQMAINFWGVAYGTKAFLPMMQAQDDGVMVNISSVFGIVAWPSQSAYNASKFAVRGFTESLRHELAGTGVTVICVHPGGIRTNIVRNGRIYKDDFGRPDAAKQMERDFERMTQTSPEGAAHAIVHGIERRQVRVLIGNDAWLLEKISHWFPVRYFGVLRWLTNTFWKRR